MPSATPPLDVRGCAPASSYPKALETLTRILEELSLTTRISIHIYFAYFSWQLIPIVHFSRLFTQAKQHYVKVA